MKKFTMVVTIDENGLCNIDTINQGLNPFELLGILECKRDDIIRQIGQDTKTNFKRTWIDNGRELDIAEEETK